MVCNCVSHGIRCKNLAVQSSCCRLCHPWLTGTVPPDNTSHFRSTNGRNVATLTEHDARTTYCDTTFNANHAGSVISIHQRQGLQARGRLAQQNAL